jgi:nucleoside 2-deoxyribosyltransferase
MAYKIYLAGPDVFLEDWRAVSDAKKALCRSYGFEGVFPLDGVLEKPRSKRQFGYQISRANETLMRNCDLIIANMTPFRGPSMDVGTAFEMGFMRGLGKPVLGYSNVKGNLLSRTVAHLGKKAAKRKGAKGVIEDDFGMMIEDFGLVDNLMLDGAVDSSGVKVVTTASPVRARYSDLRGFEQCLKRATALFRRKSRLRRTSP